MSHIRLLLEGRPEVVGDARHALDALSSEMEAPALEDLRLLVSELVTNSVLHAPTKTGEPCIQVTVDVRRTELLVVVEDPGRGFVPDVKAPGPDRAYGWGLLLLDRLASDWGVFSDGRTKVWFTMARGGPARRQPAQGDSLR